MVTTLNKAKIIDLVVRPASANACFKFTEKSSKGRARAILISVIVVCVDNAVLALALEMSKQRNAKLMSTMPLAKHKSTKPIRSTQEERKPSVIQSAGARTKANVSGIRMSKGLGSTYFLLRLLLA